MAIKRFICVNCGKIVSPQTLICDACGTDYNEEKPKCEHFYTRFMYARNPINMTVELLLKCEKCGEVLPLHCSEKLIFDILNCTFEV